MEDSYINLPKYMREECLCIYFTNSNIIWGERYACRDIEPDTYEFSIRIHFESIFSLMEAGRVVKNKVLAGSVPPSCDALWAYAHRIGCSTDLLRKVEKDNGRLGEQGVDEILHLRMANTILDHPAPTMVVATGDGRVSEFGTGFITQIDRALKAGWEVEVWSWSQVCNRIYQTYSEDAAKGLTLRHYDTYYYNITFLRAGGYYRDDADGVRQHIIVRDRRIARFE